LRLLNPHRPSLTPPPPPPLLPSTSRRTTPRRWRRRPRWRGTSSSPAGQALPRQRRAAAVPRAGAQGYRNLFPWPASRDVAWSVSVRHGRAQVCAPIERKVDRYVPPLDAVLARPTSFKSTRQGRRAPATRSSSQAVEEDSPFFLFLFGCSP
jgi:hypothetical protein